MSRTTDLGASAEAEREARERRTAVAAAVREFTRTGSGRPPAAFIERLQARHDGTAMTTRDTRPEPSTTTTNHADDITSGYAPMSGRED